MQVVLDVDTGVDDALAILLACRVSGERTRRMVAYMRTPPSHKGTAGCRVCSAERVARGYAGALFVGEVESCSLSAQSMAILGGSRAVGCDHHSLRCCLGIG